MNRITVTIEFCDDVDFRPENVPTLLSSVRDLLSHFSIDPNMVNRIDGFQETKKRYHS